MFATAGGRHPPMGIVAFCPQGHRVKVKDHLAGRKGVCPECGGRFRIPFESEPEAAKPDFSPPPSVAGSAGIPVARVVSLDAELAATLPRALPLAPPAAGTPPE
jgi:hypothetical protein